MTDSEIMRMRKLGYTYQQIADIEGVSRQRIHQRVNHIKSEKEKGYYCHDITFCMNAECTEKKCERNQCHIRWDLKPYNSFAHYEDTEHCLKGVSV